MSFFQVKALKCMVDQHPVTLDPLNDLNTVKHNLIDLQFTQYFATFSITVMGMLSNYP